MRRSHPAHPLRDRSHRALPQLGRRGGGWVTAQVVLLAAIFLSALVRFSWPGEIEPFARAVGGILAAAGLGLLAVAGSSLAKIRALTPFPAPRPSGGLQTSGIYRYVRHPMYGGGIVLGVGWSMIFASALGLALTLVLAVLADLKADREELWLEQTFPRYTEYREQTPRKLIPFVW